MVMMRVTTKGHLVDFCIADHANLAYAPNSLKIGPLAKQIPANLYDLILHGVTTACETNMIYSDLVCLEQDGKHAGRCYKFIPVSQTAAVVLCAPCDENCENPTCQIILP